MKDYVYGLHQVLGHSRSAISIFRDALDTHEQIVGSLWDFCSLGVVAVISGDVVNSILRITLILFVKYLPRDSFDGLDYTATGLTWIELH